MPKSTVDIPKAILPVAACLVLCGCIHLEQRFHLQTSGSCQVELKYSTAEGTAPLLVSARRTLRKWQGGTVLSAEKGDAWPADEKTARDYFTGNRMNLSRYTAFAYEGRQHVQIAVTTPNLAEALTTGKLGAFVLERNRDGNIVFRADLPRDPGATVPSEARQKELQNLCGDLRLALQVTVPAKIVTTTGVNVGERQVRWVFDVQEDPWELRCLAGDPASIETISRLRGELTRWRDSTDDPAHELGKTFWEQVTF